MCMMKESQTKPELSARQSCMFYYCCILLLLCGRSLALDRSDFFPDGPDLIMLENDDDVYVPEVSIPSPFPFFGVVYNSIGVSSEGLLTLNGTAIIIDDLFQPRLFPTEGVIIASFWADSDTTLSGNITYSTNNDSSVLERAASVINASYPILASSFTPSYMFILTWIDVEYKRLKRDERDLFNSHQCVLVTDGVSISFIMFLYPEDGIQWTTGASHGGEGGLLQSDVTDPDDIAAVAGYNNGQNSSNYFMLPNSGTNSVTEWATTSNIGVPGLWIFPAFELPATTEPPTTEQPTGNNNSSVSTPSGGCGNVNPTETNMSTNGTDSMNISGARAEMFSQLEIGLLVAVIVLVVILICVLLCCCCMLICCSRRSSKEKESPVEVTEIKSSNHSAT